MSNASFRYQLLTILLGLLIGLPALAQGPSGPPPATPPATPPGAPPGAAEQPAPAQQPAPAPAPAPVPEPEAGRRAEQVIFTRNFHPDGQDPYGFSPRALQVTAVTPTPKGVRITYADGHTLEVSSNSEVSMDVLRNGHDELDEGTGSFCDVLGAAFLVKATPEEVNHAIRDVDGYVSFFQSSKKLYKHTWYSRARKLDLGEQENQGEARTIARNEATVTQALRDLGYHVPDPESSLLDLRLTIGHGNFVVRSEANPVLITTCYQVYESGSEPEELVAILNENVQVRLDLLGGSQRQNVVWVLEPVPERGTLVRYVYACIIKRPLAALVTDKRWYMSQKNVEEYTSGICRRTLALRKE